MDKIRQMVVTRFEVSALPPCTLLLSTSLQTDVNHPKVLVVDNVIKWFFTINITVNTTAVRLERNTDKYAGGEAYQLVRNGEGGRFMELPTTASVECSSLLCRV
jgi:hypothetical protein